MKRLFAIVVLTFVIISLAFGHQQPVAPPKRGPEVLRLGSMVGTWKTDYGETVTYEWFDGGFSLIGHVENPDKSTELRIITYDPEAKNYTHYRITSTGPGGTLGHMTVSGNTWRTQWDGTEDGKPAKYRFSIVEVTPTSATAKLEVSVADGPWIVTFETKSVKIK
jgi:hypothetical protein